MSAAVVYNAGVDQMPEITALQDNISRLLKERGWSMNELNRRAGLSTSSVNQVFLGRARSPKLDTVVKIATALEVSVSELLGQGEAQAARSRLQQVFDGLAEDQQALLLRVAEAMQSKEDVGR